MDYIYKQLKNWGRVKINASLAKFNSFKIGGPADLLLVVDNQADLVSSLNFLAREGQDFFILGGGSNVLFPDDGLRGVVIKVQDKNLRVKNGLVETAAGVDLSVVVQASVKESLGGFEWAAGIPGSLGGAVRGNAGAHYAFTGGEIKDTLVSVSVWRDGEVLEIANKDCEFGYRDSIFKHNNDVILGATIQLTPGNQAASLLMTQQIIVERTGKQSREPSAGSFFKNVFLSEWPRDPKELPERFIKYNKIAAGWLIEQAGLKGYQVGRAMISREHANFIVNVGGATQGDVLAIVDEVKGRVYNTFGINLEPEVQIVR